MLDMTDQTLGFVLRNHADARTPELTQFDSGKSIIRNLPKWHCRFGAANPSVDASGCRDRQPVSMPAYHEQHGYER